MSKIRYTFNPLSDIGLQRLNINDTTNLHNVTGLQAALDNKLDIDGDGSQLTNIDADTLNGLNSSDFVKKSGDTMTGNLIVESRIGIGTTSPYTKLEVVGTISSGAGSSAINLGMEFGGLLDPAAMPSQIRGVIGALNNGAGVSAGSIGYQPRTGVGASHIFFTEQSEKMRITSTGNVGIGTSTPSEKLEVDGNVKADSFKITNNSTDDSWFKKEITYTDSSGGWARNLVSIENVNNSGDILNLGLLGNGTGYTYSFLGFGAYNSTNNLRITPNGKFGFGKTPSEKVDINGNVKADKLIFNDGGVIWLNSNKLDIQANSSCDGLRLTTTTSKPIEFYTNGTLRGTILANGNYGIATSTPTEKLEVNGSVKANGDIITDLNDNYLIGNSSSYPFSHTNTIGVRIGAAKANSVDGPSGEIDFRRWNGSANLHDSARITQVKKNGNGDRGLGIHVSKETTNSASSTLAMFIDTTQQVGIGTDNPNERLDVNGNVKADNFIGDGSQLTNIDADTLDGFNSSDFVRRTGNIDETITGIKIFEDNVGIGTSNPQERLHVNGAIKATNTFNARFIKIESSSAYIDFKNDDFSYINRFSNSRLLLNSGGGNVAVGNIIPGEKLHVNGNVKATQFIGDGSQLTDVNAITLNGHDETNFVKTSGDETINGIKTFEEIIVDGNIETDTLTISGINTNTTNKAPFIVYNSNNKQIELSQNTAWQSVTLDTNVTGSISSKIINDRLIINGTVTGNSPTSTLVGQLPAGHEPSRLRRAFIFIDSSKPTGMIVDNDGRIYIDSLANGGQYNVDTELTLNIED